MAHCLRTGRRTTTGLRSWLGEGIPQPNTTKASHSQIQAQTSMLLSIRAIRFIQEFIRKEYSALRAASQRFVEFNIDKLSLHSNNNSGAVLILSQRARNVYTVAKYKSVFSFVHAFASLSIY